MTEHDLAALVEQYTGLTDRNDPAYAQAYRLAFAMMAATYEDCQAESRKDLPSPAGKESV